MISAPAQGSPLPYDLARQGPPPKPNFRFVFMGLLTTGALLIAGCGGPSNTTRRRRDRTPANANQSPASVPETPVVPPSPADDPDWRATVAALGVAGADHAALVDRLSLDGARAAYAERAACCAADTTTLAWLALRTCRLQIHLRRGASARADCTLAADAGGAVAALAHESLRLLDASGVAQPRRIGLLLPLSGEYAPIGKWARQAIKLAMSEDPAVVWVEADTRGEAAHAAAEVRRLVNDAGVVAILGPIGHHESRAAAAMAESLEVPLVTLSSAEDVADAGTFVFQHRTPPTAQAEAVGRYACDHLGLKRFAILYADSEPGRALMRRFWETVETCGGEVRGAEPHPVTGESFHNPIKRLIGRHPLFGRRPDPHWRALNRKASDPGQKIAPILDFDALFIADGPRAGLIMPYLQYWDVPLRTAPGLDAGRLADRYGGRAPTLVQVLGPAGFDDARFFRRAGPEADNAVFALGFRPVGDAGLAFAEAFVRIYNRSPDGLAAHAYDAARLLAALSDGRPDRASMRRGLLDLTEYIGVFGASRFDGEGRIVVPVGMGTFSHALREVSPLSGAGDNGWTESPTDAPTIFVEDDAGTTEASP